MKRVAFCASCLLGLSACVIVNGNKPDRANTLNKENTPVNPREQSLQPQEGPVVRGAASGRRQILVSFYATGSDCGSLGYPILKVAEAPQHGGVDIEEGTAPASFAQADVRQICNGKNVAATVVYYTSVADFVGEDSLTLERIGVRGDYGHHTYIIHVR